MNYKQIYDNLINSRKLLNRSKKTGTYESHHIIPKCLRGTNDKDNLVLLTPREHFIAHLLLTQMYEGKIKAKMCLALLKMCSNNPFQKRYISSRQYDLVKRLIVENCSGKNATFFGKKHSEETKSKMSIRMKGKNNHRYGIQPWNFGKKLKPHTNEAKLKMRESHLGKKFSDEAKLKMSISAKGKPKSENHKKRLSEVNIGKKYSDERKLQMSLSRKGIKQKIIKCPHCNKVGGTAMYRWHFNKCKIKF